MKTRDILADAWRAPAAPARQSSAGANTRLPSEGHTQLRRRAGDGYDAVRGARILATLTHGPHPDGAGPCWTLTHASGRIDRFESFDEARSDALKLW